MITEQTLVATVGRVEVTVLRHWVELGWITPEQNDSGPVFDEQDVARVELISDLVYDCEIDEESVAIMLSLIDQLHDARRLLRVMASAIDRQPEDVRRQIMHDMERVMLPTGRDEG